MTAPRSQPHLRFRSAAGEHLFLAAYSRLFDLPDDPGLAAEATGRDALARLAMPAPGEQALDLVPDVAPQSISLNVSASCNLACSYCYAGQGGFGGRQPRGMDWETARQAIDALLKRADPKRTITIGFLGGEPFVARELIHRCVHHAAAIGERGGLDIRFSVTTNATLLRDEDRALLRAHRFAVTVSIDGDREAHDRQRPAQGGRGSWNAAVRRITPLLLEPGLARIAARATVTRNDLDLPRQFAALVEAGFDEIGFSPLRRSAAGNAGLEGADWRPYLASLEAVAQGELARAQRGLPIRLTNLAVALKEIARGAASPYPCGAGGGYFSVGSDGGWYACHRAIGDEAYRLGDGERLDAAARRKFLISHHVDSDTDCTTCWARYLCSGGCHHERSARTKASCDFIRSWLEYCLIAFCEARHVPKKEALCG